jgi:uncharacterized cupredoxin-like copper-binding protein
MIRRLAVLVSTAAALALGLAACGADDRRVADPAAQAPAGATSRVAVTAKDLSLAPSKVRAEAGDVHFTYRNEGSLEHTLVIEGVDGFKLDVPTKGDTDDGSVTLAPGSYTLYCDVAGHRQAGMHATLTVQ